MMQFRGSDRAAVQNSRVITRAPGFSAVQYSVIHQPRAQGSHNRGDVLFACARLPASHKPRTRRSFLSHLKGLLSLGWVLRSLGPVVLFPLCCSCV